MLSPESFFIMRMNYQTSDFPTASVLLLRKHRLLNVDRSAQRVIFEFEDTEQLQTDINQLQSGDLRVEPLDYWTAQRRCKQLLYGS